MAIPTPSIYDVPRHIIIDKTTEILSKSILSKGNCLIFCGRSHRNSKNYGTSSFTVLGFSKRLFIDNHRLIYFESHNVLPQHDVVSHLCHNPKCLNIEHLSVEPQAINISRQDCKIQKSHKRRCKGHEGYPNCIP